MSPGSGGTKKPKAAALEQALRGLEASLRNELVDRRDLFRFERAVVGLVARQRLPRQIGERDVDDLRLGQPQGPGDPGSGLARHAVGGVLVAVAQQDAGGLAWGGGSLCGHGSKPDPILDINSISNFAVYAREAAPLSAGAFARSSPRLWNRRQSSRQAQASVAA